VKAVPGSRRSDREFGEQLPAVVLGRLTASAARPVWEVYFKDHGCKGSVLDPAAETRVQGGPPAVLMAMKGSVVRLGARLMARAT